jgi:hypothetical protein
MLLLGGAMFAASALLGVVLLRRAQQGRARPAA